MILSDEPYPLTGHRGSVMVFNRSEQYVIWLTVAAVACSAVLSVWKGVDVLMSAFLWPLFLDFCLLGGGLYYRLVRRNEEIAVILISVALLIISGHAFGVLNYLQLPYAYHGVDQLIESIDLVFGFQWAPFVIWISQFERFCDFLRLVYQSCAWQIIIIVFALAIAGRAPEVGKYMLAMVIGAAVTTEAWALFPSSTPAAFQPLPADIAARLGLVVSPEQGAWLKQISYAGVSSISPDTLTGVIGFPSYHTVLAMTAVYYARTVRKVFWPIAAWNIFMVPAIIVHGSHGIVDVFGGIAVTALSIWLAANIGNPLKFTAPARPAPEELARP
jgi:hypothetical protein